MDQTWLNSFADCLNAWFVALLSSSVHILNAWNFLHMVVIKFEGLMNGM
jgi:hypothetical protein